MAQTKTRVWGIVFTAIIFAGNFSFSASAAGNETNCNLNKDKFEELKAIQNNLTLDYLEQIRQELKIRRELLKITTNCATEDAKTLYANLNSATTSDPEIQSLRTKLADRLEGGINYYELQKSKINDLGLRGSHDFARSLADWREGNYKPAAKAAQNLVIWSRNQIILETAQKRIDQVSRTANLLKLVDNDEIQNIWTGAQDNFKAAIEANQKAKILLRANDNQDITLSAIHSSLAALSKTYQKFFELNEALNKVLPR